MTPRLHHLAVTGRFVSFARSAIGTACGEQLTKVNKKDVHSQPVADTHGDENPTNTLLSVSSNLIIQCTKEAVNQDRNWYLVQNITMVVDRERGGEAEEA